MKPLGVGMIGAGLIGKCHALAWRAVAGVFGVSPAPRLVTLCATKSDETRDKAEKWGFETATTDWRALLADPRIDAISIVTPHKLHPEMAIAALKAGKHVWCEKPMAPSLEQAQAMTAAAEASGRVAILGYNYIQNPALRLARKLLEDDAIGSVNHIRIEMDEDFMADTGRIFNWQNEAATGYGVLDGFGSHQLSLLAFLLGTRGRVARVSGTMATSCAERPDGKGGRRKVESFDIASALLKLENGATGVMLSNRSAWGRKGRIFVQIFGTRGSIVYDQERLNEIQLFVAEGPVETQGFRTILATAAHPPFGEFTKSAGHQIGFNDLKTIECREFLRKIHGEDALTVTFRDGLTIERTLHSLARAALEERWIDVNSGAVA